MTAPTHVVIGIAAASALRLALPIAFTPVDLLILILGSLAPDIDANNATIHRPGSVLRRLISRPFVRLLDGCGALVGFAVSRTTKHRGFFHWPLVALVLIAVSISLQSRPLFWFSIGYLSHILADSLTPAGVPFYAPFSRKKVAFARIQTGSIFERLLCIAMLLLLVTVPSLALPDTMSAALQQLPFSLKNLTTPQR